MDTDERIPSTADVPYIVFETAQARLERANKRLAALLILLIVLLCLTNAAWLWYEGQFEDVVVTQRITTEDARANVSGTGDANYYGENDD